MFAGGGQQLSHASLAVGVGLLPGTAGVSRWRGRRMCRQWLPTGRTGPREEGRLGGRTLGRGPPRHPGHRDTCLGQATAMDWMGQDPHSPWVREAHGPTSHHGHGPPVTWHPWLMTVCCLVVQGWPHGVPGGFWRCQPHCPTGSQRTSPAPTLGGAARDRQETGRWHAVPQPEPTGSTCRRVGAADAHTHAERMNTGHAHGTGDTTPPRGRASEDCGATSGHLYEKGVSWGVGDPNWGWRLVVCAASGLCPHAPCRAVTGLRARAALCSHP